MKFSLTIQSDDANEIVRFLVPNLPLTAALTLPAPSQPPQPGNPVGFAVGTGGAGPAPQPVSTDPDDIPAAAGKPSGVDVTGLPWNEQIHAASGAKNADGRWRQRRSVDPSLVAQVEAALRQQMGTPIAPQPVAAPQPIPVAAPQPVPTFPMTPQPVATDDATPIDFGTLMQALNTSMQAGKISDPNAYVVSLTQRLGIPDLTVLNGDAAKCAQVRFLMRQDGVWVS